MSSEDDKELAAVMPIDTYLVFRSVAEFYSIMLENGLKDWEGFEKCLEIYHSNVGETLQ